MTDSLPPPSDDAFDEGVITEVIRPAAIVPEESARSILVELSLRDVRNGGVWRSDPSRWALYDSPWPHPTDQGTSLLVGTMQVAYSTPTRYEITIYRATITRVGSDLGWTVESLCDEALGFGSLTLANCPRATLTEPPKPFRF
ncbi:MAG: hypothetical protein F2842_04180 [Actinobacteria bacterium]|uniref:Unannotated protein n=1 Tax=freshwater metagenome TaxID=449393 RepID=A0A6J7JC59_9ZZZZ|nr:hypothetical protein [Actinomycetota bacterium]MSW41386.1 hypothetical protein [Actinomycetota bacterium]